MRRRLLLGTLLVIALAVSLTAWNLQTLFREHLHEQLKAQLLMQLDQLSGAIDWTGGAVRLEAVSVDSRLEQPFSGLYWQIDRLGDRPRAELIRSRSLWDQVLAMPARSAGIAPSGVQVIALQDARNHELLGVARIVQLPEEDAPPLRLVVAGDLALIAGPIRQFTRMLLVSLTLLTIILMGSVAVQFQFALRPLNVLRQRLAIVRRGEVSVLEGNFPQEIQPLVNEFNHVLEENTRMVERARMQAGNLAHAVNTPLTILANAASREAGPLARLVREQAAMAHRQVEHHLARARATAAARTTGRSVPIMEPLRAVLRTMARLHAERNVVFVLDEEVPEGLFHGEEQDLYEILGNLLDNAGKWAKSIVRVGVRREEKVLLIQIDDDGEGVPAQAHAQIFLRGARLDERHPGAGLGLDIVKDLVTAYGGSVQSMASPLGGLRVVIRLPEPEGRPETATG